jgi:uncharacterized protein
VSSQRWAESFAVSKWRSRSALSSSRTTCLSVITWVVTESAEGRFLDLDGHPGLLIRPKNARALYVFAHGAGAGMRYPLMSAIAGALADLGIATLRWEFPYMAEGKSRPDRPEVAEATVREVWLASKRVARGLPRFAGGRSFGGRMTSRAHAASPLPDLRGIAFLGFPLHLPDAPATERAEHLAKAEGPLLFLQGTRDDLADLTLLRPVIKKLGSRAKLHVLDGADHGFAVLVRSGRTGDEVIQEVASTVADWIEAILDTA